MSLTQMQRKSRWAYTSDTRRYPSASWEIHALRHRPSHDRDYVYLANDPLGAGSLSRPLSLYRSLEIIWPFRLQQDTESITEGLRSLFDNLVKAWNEDTMMSSSMREVCTHWAYQRVIGLGFPVVPLILERIQEGDRHWGWALTSITGENPAENLDSLRLAAESWIRWGAKRGLLRRESAFLD